MKTRLSLLSVFMAALLIVAASVTAYAYNNAREKTKNVEPKNELIFNWVSSS